MLLYGLVWDALDPTRPMMRIINYSILYNTVESEYQFLLICPKYYELRLKYLPRVAWPTINKYINIMITKKSKLLFNIAKYTTEAFKIRTQAIDT